MKSEKNKVDVLIRRAYKSAFGLPVTTNTKRLLQLRLHNTLDEIAEAQRTAQLERLSSTKAGRKIACKLGIGYHEQKGPKCSTTFPTTYGGTCWSIPYRGTCTRLQQRQKTR